jgi:predicted nucleic acid-binding protein
LPNAISNTSPLVYLHRIDKLHWLSQLFDSVWTPPAVVVELQEGLGRGYDVPSPDKYEWLEVVTPRQAPSEWFALDLGAGEIAAMSLALENREQIVILDDALARHVARAAGLHVWGTLRVLLTAKNQGLTETIAPHVIRLRESGMWISDEVQHRILQLAGER